MPGTGRRNKEGQEVGTFMENLVLIWTCKNVVHSTFRGFCGLMRTFMKMKSLMVASVKAAAEWPVWGASVVTILLQNNFRPFFFKSRAGKEHMARLRPRCEILFSFVPNCKHRHMLFFSIFSFVFFINVRCYCLCQAPCVLVYTMEAANELQISL